MIEDPRHGNGAEKGGWAAELELWFDVSAPRTRLARRRHFGPLVVQRPFYPERDGTCHVYLLHPPGGVAGGDSLRLTFHLAEGARVLLTTPAATKFYRSTRTASQCNVFELARGTTCEYLPQETIVFAGADADLSTCVSLDATATYVGWDFVCLGRLAANERFSSGKVTQRVEISREGKLIWFERFSLPADSPLQKAVYALAGRPVFGTMVYAGRLDGDLSEAVRQAVGRTDDCYFSISQLDEVVVCRYLGQQAEQGKKLFTSAWDALRVGLQSKPAIPPRIWAT